MKLIVDIDKKDYDRVKKGKLLISVFNACVYAIENGVPLEDIKAEIILYENNYKFDNCRCRFDNYRNYNNNVESLESIIRRIKHETDN